MITFTKALEILKHHQRWRLGEIDEMPYKPLEITEALDVLLLFVDEVSPKDMMTDPKNWQCNWKGEESWGDMEKNIHEHLNKK